jgi:hypothetical protein
MIKFTKDSAYVIAAEEFEFQFYWKYFSLSA